MGTEDWVLKGTKLITKTEKQIIDSQKYNIKEKKKKKTKSQKLKKNIYI